MRATTSKMSALYRCSRFYTPYTYIHAYIHTVIHSLIYTHMHACIHTYILIYILIYVMPIYIYTYVHTYGGGYNCCPKIFIHISNIIHTYIHTSDEYGKSNGIRCICSLQAGKDFCIQIYVCMYVCMHVYLYIAVVISDNVQLTQFERCMYCMYAECNYAECNYMYLLISLMCDDVRFRKGSGCH